MICHCEGRPSRRGAFGLEPTIEMYVAHTVEILREVRRVLRPDGVCFWNVGDSYSSFKDSKTVPDSLRSGAGTGTTYSPHRDSKNLSASGLKPKDLCLIPARVALAAQSEGWWVRSLIIWAKPNPMPESVTDRPTDAYEHIIMLTKSERYFWDADAVREPQTGKGFRSPNLEVVGGRNLRNVWTFPTQPYKGAHFATFPEEIPRRCILAATSARGACAQCGAPWERVVRASGGTIGRGYHEHDNDLERGQRSDPAMTDGSYRRDSLGWRPTCLCLGQRGRTVPCLVVDPFGGSGTTGRVAVELNRDAAIFDIAYDAAYGKLAVERTTNVQRNLL